MTFLIENTEQQQLPVDGENLGPSINQPVRENTPVPRKLEETIEASSDFCPLTPMIGSRRRRKAIRNHEKTMSLDCNNLHMHLEIMDDAVAGCRL